MEEKLKYDILLPFKEYLRSNMNPNTARKYYSSVLKLLKNKQFNSFSELRKEDIEAALRQFTTKNEFSAAKNGLLQLKKFYPDLQIPDENFFKESSMSKRNRSKKPKKILYLDEIKRKVNQISNKKLKYAYRLAIVSGLRVNELASLNLQEDIAFQDGKIFVTVKNGKGGSNGIVECLPDPYLYKNLAEYISSLGPGENSFYSEVYMREKANDLGLECHDFRRIFAITARNQLKKEMPVYEANKIVQAKLRHVRFSTTKRYLFNRKLVVKRSQYDGERIK